MSLDLQDRVIEALRTHVVDDVHLSHAISRLLELLTTSIRKQFLRFAPMDRGGDGEAPDRPAAPTSRHHSPHSNPKREGSSHAWTPTQQNPSHSHSHSVGYFDNNSTTHHPIDPGHDPLAGIPAQPINSSNINVSFMPPPPSVYYNYLDPSTTPSNSDLDGPNVPSHSMNDHSHSGNSASASGGLPDWFALPLDQFFNSSTAVVDQGLGGTGPMVGELDMLEVLLNEQYDGTGTGNGNGGGGGGNGEHGEHGEGGSGNFSTSFLHS